MAMKMYRLGVACLIHDHVWNELECWADLPNVDLVAAGDENKPLRTQIKDHYGVQRLYESWQEMIEQEELDIVQAASDNATGAAIVEAAAAKGMHVISEKPMSARLSQADRMLAAAEKHGTRLMINWPTLRSAAWHTFARMIRGGELGGIFYLKYRAAHNGPKEIGCSEYFWKWLYDEEKNGAGALMDYCCYAAVMMSYLLGTPNSCVGMRGVLVKDYELPDDNAMILAKYDHAFGVAEACWTQPVATSPLNPIAYGSRGCIGIDGDAVVITRGQDAPHTIQPDPLPVGQRSGPEYFVHCIETGEEIEGLGNAQISRNAQEILEAGLISSNTGQEVRLPVS